MKKILLTSVVALGAVGAYAQGTVNFANRVISRTVSHIYSPDTATPGVQFTGNTSTDLPTGNQVYTGTLIGGNTTGTYAAQNYTAQLWALTGTGNPAASLQPVTQYTTTFHTSLAGVFLEAAPSSDPGIPSTSAGAATLQVRVWDNGGGTRTTWAAGSTGTVIHGTSPTFDLTNLGGVGSPAAPQPNLTGLVSFSLVQSVPEPSTIALGVMGAAAFLLRRRNK